MKIVNIKRYRDRETNEIQEIGTERDVSEERAVEIIEAGYAEEIKNSNDDNAGNPDDNTENPDDNAGNPDDNTENPDDNTENPDDNTENPDDNTENPDDSSKPDEKAKNKKSTGANK